MPRILENEAMMTQEEVLAYDQLVKKYMTILHYGFIESVINLSPLNGIFLEVGTGTGWIAIGVAKNNPDVEVFAIDISENMLDLAKKNAEAEGVQKRIHFQKGDAKNIPYKDKKFDSVFSHNMMHHIPEPIHMINEIKRVAKEDAAILVRDLKRQSKIMAEIHVKLLGFTYNRLMKKEYRDSILAALSEEEWKSLLLEACIPGSKLTKQFITHLTIERSAKQKRETPLKIQTSSFIGLLKTLYSSQP